MACLYNGNFLDGPARQSGATGHLFHFVKKEEKMPTWVFASRFLMFSFQSFTRKCKLPDRVAYASASRGTMTRNILNCHSLTIPVLAIFQIKTSNHCTCFTGSGPLTLRLRSRALNFFLLK